MKKYELTENKRTIGRVTLYQIRAVCDFADVHTGDLGGWVENEHNLSQDDDAWISGNAQIYGDTRVCGNASVSGGKWVQSPLYIQGSRDELTTSSDTEIKIGSERHSIDYWRENFIHIGKKHGYTESQIDEYKEYIDIAAKRLENISKQVEKK